MIKIYQWALLPSAQRWFMRKIGYCKRTMIQNIGVYCVFCTAWKEENDVDVLDWSSQSPEANLIENVWALIKFKLREKKIWTIKQLFWQIRPMEVFVSRLWDDNKISRKFASEMPGNYY